jgi:hypothetical protein
VVELGFGDLPEIFLLLISNLVPLWSQNILWGTLILLNLLRLVLWFHIWSVLVNILNVLALAVYSVGG